MVGNCGETMIDLYQLVKELTGDIEPIGATHIDEKKYVNLERQIELVEKLLFDLDRVARLYKDRTEYSMKKAGEKAHEFLELVKTT